MHIVIEISVELVVDPFPFEEEKSVSPPSLLFNLVGLPRIVLGNGFLKLEV